MNRSSAIGFAFVLSSFLANTYSASIPIHSRIVNGYNATNNQFPWHVSIQSILDKNKRQFCGGSVISDSWILTAAHCIHGFNTFLLGFGSILHDEPVLTMLSESWIEYPDYDPSKLTNDIALIRLPTRLTFNENIQPIQFPSFSDATQSFVNKKCLISGFGHTSNEDVHISNKLMWTELSVVTNEQCKFSYGGGVVKDSNICTVGWTIDAQSPCSGDSGGALVIKVQQRWIQIGIMSFVPRASCTSGSPAGFTRLTSYLKWLSQNTGIKIRN